MSTYINASGTINFENEESMLKGIEPLVKNGYLLENEDGSYTLMAEENTEVSHDVLDTKEYHLEIPLDCYKNIGRIMDSVLEHADSGRFEYYCTDGSNSLCSWQDGQVEKFDTDASILRLAGTTNQIDIDVLAFDPETFEDKYDKDYHEYLRNFMLDALDKV